MSIHTIWGPPQSGKTTVAMNLAKAFASQKKTVCLVSLAPYGEMAALLGKEIPVEKSLQTALKGTTRLLGTAMEVEKHLYVLAPHTQTNLFEELDWAEQSKALMSNMTETYDEIIVDCISYPYHRLMAWALNHADNVLIIMGGHITEPEWLHSCHMAMEAISDKVLFVTNRTGKNFDFDTLYRCIGKSPHGELPHVPTARILQIQCQLLYGTGGKAYTNAISQLGKELSP